jgi:TIR domain
VSALLLVATAGIAGAEQLGHPSGAVSSSPGPHAVFLSYASQDAEAARRLCEALRAAGIEVWFDRSELRGGDAVISAHTEARSEGYFRREWKLAVDRTDDMAGDVPFLLKLPE